LFSRVLAGNLTRLAKRVILMRVLQFSVIAEQLIEATSNKNKTKTFFFRFLS